MVTPHYYTEVVDKALEVSIDHIGVLQRKGGYFIVSPAEMTDMVTAIVKTTVLTTDAAVRKHLQREQYRSLLPVVWDMMSAAQRREARKDPRFEETVKFYDLTLP